MAHNLLTLNGRAAMTYLDSTPWHGLGEKLNLRDIARTAMLDAALDAAQLRYKVASTPIYLPDGTEITGYKSSVRLASDGSIAAFLAVVGEGYNHVQNERACDIARVLIESFGCVPAAAGALGNGERCWLLLRIADATITPVDGDDVNGYFLLQWGHDGNISIVGLGTAIRVICQNTLNLALSAAGKKAWFTIRHTSGADARVDEAARLMARVMDAMKQSGDTFATMAQKRLSASEITAYIESVFPADAGKVGKVLEARRDTVQQLVYSGRGAAMASQAVDTSNGGASLWAAYNAVTEYFDHVRTAEAKSDSGLRRAQESAIFGGNADIKADALHVARQLLGAAA